jgi:hypothetical protein
MIVVDYDHQYVVKFYCDKCDFRGEYDISNLLTDNCAIDVDVICDLCGDSRVLYVLKCEDEAQAKELNAKLAFLKIMRSAGVKEYGDQSNGEIRDCTT